MGRLAVGRLARAPAPSVGQYVPPHRARTLQQASSLPDCQNSVVTQSLATVSLDCQPAEADAESSCCTSGCRPGGPAAAGDGEAAPACRAAAGAAATTISHLPLELLGCILEAVLEDDAAHERRWGRYRRRGGGCHCMRG